MSRARHGNNVRLYSMQTHPPPAVLTALLALFLSLTGTASTSTVFEERGDLYLETPQRSVRLTSYGRNYAPVVSPDGQWVVYLSTPEWVVGGGYLPTNVWLMNLRTRVARRLADQPVYASQDGPFVCRDLLVWSGDSQRVAWLEWRITSDRDPTKPSPTFVVSHSVVRQHQQEVRVHQTPPLLGWRDQEIFARLWASNAVWRWEKDDLIMSVSMDGKASTTRLKLNLQTGALSVVPR